MSALYFCDRCGAEVTGRRSYLTRVQWQEIVPVTDRYGPEPRLRELDFTTCDPCAREVHGIMTRMFRASPVPPRRA